MGDFGTELAKQMMTGQQVLSNARKNTTVKKGDVPEAGVSTEKGLEDELNAVFRQYDPTTTLMKEMESVYRRWQVENRAKDNVDGLANMPDMAQMQSEMAAIYGNRSPYNVLLEKLETVYRRWQNQ